MKTLCIVMLDFVSFSDKKVTFCLTFINAFNFAFKTPLNVFSFVFLMLILSMLFMHVL